MHNPDYSFKNNVKSEIVAILVLYLFFPSSAVKGDWVSDANVRIEQIRKRYANYGGRFKWRSG